MPDSVVQLESHWRDMDSLAYLASPPTVSASIKKKFCDFKVSEDLGFDLTGSGDHLYLQIKKIDLSTIDVAKKLASSTQQRVTSIGYAGMKDRRGECTQWFSVPLETLESENLESIERDNLQIISSKRNSRKLKIGSHKLNHFEIILRNCTGGRKDFESNILRIKKHGVPNYFGQQRFGKELSNLKQLNGILREKVRIGSTKRKPFKRSLVISAARAYLFNQLLSERLNSKNWDTYVDGDVLNLNGTDRNFVPDQAGWTNLLQERLTNFDIHVTGGLGGVIESKNKYVCTAEAADIEKAVMEEFPGLVQALGMLGLKASRRPLRFMPDNLEWYWLDGESLKLEFDLRKGAYATSLLREICNTE
ncbi:MAG: tRNA pseudouridine(13) synthase TruD [Pseudomonadota bacterium]|nr:tRNA pseudouridine(13) synthase TruD [Pseudomonadota bacterium]